MKTFDYTHRVSFEETNVVGNVYYANFILWQGKCRELFIYEWAPGLLEEISNGLQLFTKHASCDYNRSLYALDEVTIRMSLESFSSYSAMMHFDYEKLEDGIPTRVATGSQEIRCARKDANGSTVMTEFPDYFLDALAIFS